jgi:hypothetical protein
MGMGLTGVEDDEVVVLECVATVVQKAAKSLVEVIMLP